VKDAAEYQKRLADMEEKKVIVAPKSYTP